MASGVSLPLWRDLTTLDELAEIVEIERFEDGAPVSGQAAQIPGHDKGVRFIVLGRTLALGSGGGDASQPPDPAAAPSQIPDGSQECARGLPRDASNDPIKAAAEAMPPSLVRLLSTQPW